MKKILATTAAVAALVVVGSAAPANANDYAPAPPAGSIVDVAVAASGGGTPDNNPYDYDILVQALTATGLVPVLADTSRTFTVFAPDDRAFMQSVADITGTAPATEAEALTTITTAATLDQISNVLLYHVVADQALGPIEVLLAGSLTMANGGVVKPRLITLQDENPSLPDPRLVLTGLNIRATNGVIHTIDRVLIPGTL